MKKIKFIITLDISKKSTGVCISCNTEGKIEIVGLTSIQIKNPEKYNKFYFMAGEYIKYELENFCIRNLPFSSHDRDVTCIFEYPIFSDYTSELQFYLTQILLSTFYSWGIDCVGVSTSGLKSFIKQSSYKKIPKVQSRKHLTKDQIKWIYINCLYPRNPDLPDPKTISNDDEYDALYLALYGSITVTPYLDRIANSRLFGYCKQMDLQTFWDSEYATQILLKSQNYYNLRYALNARGLDFDLKNLSFSDEPIGKQFKALRQSTIKNKHLSTTSTFYYPFSKVENINTVLNYFLLNERGETIRLLTSLLRSRTAYIEAAIDKLDSLKFAFNKKGDLFLRKS